MMKQLTPDETRNSNAPTVLALNDVIEQKPNYGHYRHYRPLPKQKIVKNRNSNSNSNNKQEDEEEKGIDDV